MYYLIVGNSYKLIDREIGKIKKDKTIKNISLLDKSLIEVLDDINYQSVFEENTISIIRDFDSLFDKKNNDEIDALIRFIENNKDKTVIFISNKKIPQNTKLFKSLSSLINTIETKTVTKNYEMVNFLKEEIRNYNFIISEMDLVEFANRCALNIDVAIMELEKLKLMTTTNRISHEDIMSIVSNYNAGDAFEFKDAVVNKKIKEAYDMISDFESQKREIIGIIVMLEKEFELIYAIKELASTRLSNDEIGLRLGKMHPYRVKVLREVGMKYTTSELERIILYLCNLDRKCVTSDNTGYSELRIFLTTL